MGARFHHRHVPSESRQLHPRTVSSFVAMTTQSDPIAFDVAAMAWDTVLWVPAGAAHFDGADEDTVIIGTAIGPWTTEYLESSDR